MAKASIDTKVDGAPLSPFTSPTKRNRGDLEEKSVKTSNTSSIFLDQPPPQEVSLKCDREVTLPVLDASVPMPEMSMQELFGANATEKNRPDANDNKRFPNLPSPTEPEPKKKQKKIEDPTQKMTPVQLAEFFKQPVLPPAATPEKAPLPWDVIPASSSTESVTFKSDKNAVEEVEEEPIDQSVFLDLPTPKNDPPTPDPKACLPIPNAGLKTPIALTDLFGEETLQSQSPSLPKRRRGFEVAGSERGEGFDSKFSAEADNINSIKTKRKKSDEKDGKKSKIKPNLAAGEVEMLAKLANSDNKNRTIDPGQNSVITDATVELLPTDTQEERKCAPPQSKLAAKVATSNKNHTIAPGQHSVVTDTTVELLSTDKQEYKHVPPKSKADTGDVPSEVVSDPAPVAVSTRTTTLVCTQPEEPMPADTVRSESEMTPVEKRDE